jgi:3-oxoacyl-[acyl-carrier-protein] synthase III
MSSPARPVRVLGTGKYLPRRRVSAAEVDARAGVPDGWTMRMIEVEHRHFIDGETASEMGAEAARGALRAAGLELADIDVIVVSNTVGEQPIPCTAALVQRALGGERSGIPCFDIDATCLGFVVALDLIGHAIAAGAYRRALIIATEVASLGLDWGNPESAALFGDGAAAVIVGPAGPGEASRLLAARLETYSAGAELAQITHGGSKNHFRAYRPDEERGFLFQMDGPGLLRLSQQVFPPFLERLLGAADLGIQDIDLVIPHQASVKAMKLVQRRLRITDAQMVFILRDHGNTISATIPMALHEAIANGRARRGDRMLLIGTSAGLSVGGVVLVY